MKESAICSNLSMNVLKYEDIKLNEKQSIAYDLVVNKEKNIFLTGVGGTGKSACIHRIKHDMLSYNKNVAITSTTGVSASLIKGVTLHSYLGIGLGVSSFEKLYKRVSSSSFYASRWRNIDLLIIDEVSMLSINLFEKLEKIARYIREDVRPFGGMQILLAGDFLQLPVVNDDNFLFESSLWDKVINGTVHLTEIIRQKDPIFQSILNKIRMGIVDDEVKKVLLSREIKYISKDGLIPTYILSTNAQVDKVNQKYYDNLEGPEFSYKVEYFWKKKVSYKEKYEPLVRFPLTLKLKVGCQVMYLVNNGGLVNGSRGIIKSFKDGYPIVLFKNGIEKIIIPEILDIEENDEKIMSYKQIPLKVAFSVTTHKSQGSSLDLARIDFKRIFECGQIYVGLSRVTSLEGLYLRNVDFNKIKANPKAVAFYKKLKI